MNKGFKVVARYLLPWAFFLNANLATPVKTFAQEAKPTNLEEKTYSFSLMSSISQKISLEEPINFYIQVNKKELIFRLFQKYDERSTLLLETPVALGRKGHSTPTGEFYLRRIVNEPFWYPTKSSKSRVPSRPGTNNPYGLWMSELFRQNELGDYAFPVKGDTAIRIHSTNEPSSIGKYLSTGCVRLPPPFAEELFPALLFYLPHKEPKKTSRGIIYPLEKTIPIFVK